MRFTLNLVFDALLSHRKRFLAIIFVVSVILILLLLIVQVLSRGNPVKHLRYSFSDNFQPLTIFAKPSNLYVCQGPEYASAVTQPAFTCSKLTTETLEQGVKYVQT